MIGICRLCHEKQQLQEKCHIYPSFVIKKAGNRLHKRNPNGKYSTQQNFYAEYLFCRNCENDVFNKRGEKPIADGYQFPKPMKDVSTDALEHFGLSVLYKALIVQSKAVPNKCFLAEGCWRTKILKPLHADSRHPVICLPTYDRPSHPIATVLNWTFNMAIVEESGYKVIWLNMPGFSMAGFLDIHHPPSADERERVFHEISVSQAKRLNAEAQVLTSLRG